MQQEAHATALRHAAHATGGPCTCRREHACIHIRAYIHRDNPQCPPLPWRVHPAGKAVLHLMHACQTARMHTQVGVPWTHCPCQYKHKWAYLGHTVPVDGYTWLARERSIQLRQRRLRAMARGKASLGCTHHPAGARLIGYTSFRGCLPHKDVQISRGVMPGCPGPVRSGDEQHKHAQ